MTSYSQRTRARHRARRQREEALSPKFAAGRADARRRYRERKQAASAMQCAFLSALQARVDGAAPCDHVTLPVGHVLASELRAVLRGLARAKEEKGIPS